MAQIDIRDCGPRDGLQPMDPVRPALRTELAVRLAHAGVNEVEVGAFVSPKAVPAMAGADEVVAELGCTPHDRRWWALVPNVRGARAAEDAGIGQLTVTISASDGYSRRNVGMGTEEAFNEFQAIRASVPTATLDAVVSCCFGSPFEVMTPGVVAELVSSLRLAGADRVTLADTTGTATPARIADVVADVGVDVGLHLHDTRGTALTNLYAAFCNGVRRFDTSLGGLGGSPFAPGSGGNVATEDVVLLMEDLGVATGIDLEELVAVSHWLSDRIGHPMRSRVAAAGPLSPWRDCPT
jgi:hydroxymethylglutaryl-CoA lyase